MLGYGAQEEDDVFCPELVSGHRTILEWLLLSATREQSPHTPEVVLITKGDQLGPGLDGPFLRIRVSTVECLQFSCAIAL